MRVAVRGPVSGSMFDNIQIFLPDRPDTTVPQTRPIHHVFPVLNQLSQEVVFCHQGAEALVSE